MVIKCTGAVLLGTLALWSQRADAQSAAASAASPMTLPVTAPVVGPIVRTITLPAQVQPLRQAILYARVPGYLASISVDKGDRVRAGQSLAQVDVPELVASRARQQAELTAAESDFKRLQESQSRAPDLVVPQMVDQARGKYEIAAASLQQSETMLRYARIVAPFAGVVTQRFVDPGALIPAGGTPIVTLMDFSNVRLQFGVPEIESANVSVGQSVQVTTDDLPGMKFEGKVARFAYALDPATRTMLTEVSLANGELKLRPGMLVSLKLGIQRHEKALLVPVEALVTDKSGSYVWKLVGGRAQRQDIRSGFNDGKSVEITEGLASADAVIVAKQALKAGQPVQAARSP
jgi:RND family efflux transporter MFP subunit